MPDKPHNYADTKRLIEEKAAKLVEILNRPMGTPGRAAVQVQLDSLRSDQVRLRSDTGHLDQLNYYKMPGITSNFDSLPSSGNGWVMRYIRSREIHLREKYGNDTKLLVTDLISHFLHTFPQMFFVSLPFFALLLKMLYHRKKQYYFTDHFIYSLHLYCAMFFFIFLQMGLALLQKVHHLGWLRYVGWAVILYMFYYLYRSMRTFYNAPRGATILKYILLLFVSSILMLLLFLSFFIFAVFTV